MRKFRYKTIFLLTSLQYANHIREYFVENSKKAIAFYILPRNGTINNFIEIYQKGKRTDRRFLYSPKNLFLWHIMLYINYLFILFTYTRKGEKVFFINYLFTFFFLHNLVRVFRNIEFVCWVGDYWPMNTISIKIYRFFVNYYHRHTRYAFYQTDRINKKMNGKIINTKYRKTIMPGINPPKINLKKRIEKELTLSFIGVLVPWQGVDLLLRIVANNTALRLRLIGTGEKKLVYKYQELIKKYKIADRVYFPNKFMYEEELHKEIKQAHIGIALYDVDDRKVTFYADPAKIKQYMEFGLPVIMTEAAEIAEYIKKFDAGIVVEKNVTSVQVAITKMKNNYTHYLKNLDKLNHWLDFRAYYKGKFSFLEKI